MKKLALASVLMASLFLAPSVFAQNPKNIRAEVIERKEERVEAREEARNRITIAKKERIMSFTNQMTLRLEATLGRLQKLVEKINARTNKITSDEEKKNIEGVKKSLDDAQKLIAKTQIQIDALKVNLDKMLDSENPKDAFMKTKDEITNIKNNLKEIHSILVSTINVIKGLRVGNSN